MRLLLVMAWRNLWRHGKRTVLTAVTIALGLAMVLLFLGLGDGSHAQMIDSAVRLGSGHVVVQAPEWQERGGLERTLPESAARKVLEWLGAQPGDPGVEGTSPRLFASALATSASGSSGVFLIGVEPELERRVSRFPGYLTAGEFLKEGDDRLVLLGAGVARKLEVGLGDKVVLMAQAADSQDLASVLVRVGGLVSTGQENLDHTLMIGSLRKVQEFLNLEGRIHQLAVVLADEGDSRALARAADSAFPELAVLSWHEALPELHDFIQIDDGGNYVFHVFLFLLISFLVLNTLLMSVLERRKEFTFLDAVGLSPQQRFGLVMLEAVLLASLASLAGFAVGDSGHLYLATYGLPLSVFNLEEGNVAGVAFEPIMYSRLSPERILQSLGTVFGMTLLLALLPARRAAAPGNIQLLGSGR